MENPKVSVIIPVYNTEEYVAEAISSIINQTISELEIIVINDGSTDNSLRILEELAARDDRIQVYSQENSGQAVARNFGLNKAKGKYIYFMDSDDLLRHDALSACYERCEKQQLDFVFFDADIFGDDQWTSSFFDYSRADYLKSGLYQGKRILNFLLDKRIYRSPVWLYLIRRHFLENISLKFYPVRHEDELFTGILYLQAQRVGYIREAYFKRRLRANSVMTSKYSFQDVSAYLKIVSQLSAEQTGADCLVTEKLIRHIIIIAIQKARTLSLTERIKIFGICMRKPYFKYLTLKSIIILLFPFTVELKSFISGKRNKYKPEE